MQYHLLYILATICQTVFKALWTIFLAICTDEQRLKSTYYPQIPRVFILHIAQVACVQPTVHHSLRC